MTASASPVVIDNTVLTNFALVQCTELIFSLWAEKACTTPVVLAEYRDGVAGGSVPEDAWKDLPVTQLSAEETNMLASLPKRLGPGEKSCLAIARCRKGAVASDDRDARKAAVALEVQISGTIGILLACVKKEILELNEANRLLRTMIGYGYRSPVESIDSLL